jgi:hypothetical protein
MARGQHEPIELPPSPSVQEVDIDFEVLDADIVVVFPKGESFQPGDLVISPRVRWLRYAFDRTKMDQEGRRIVQLTGGEYQATFVSRDRKWHGTSEWVRIAKGSENTIIVDVMKTVRGVRIGGWEPGQLSNVQFTPVRYDVRSIIQSRGEITILCFYETGRHAAEVDSVALIENGRPISRDSHLCWAGNDQWNNSYRLSLDSYNPDATYEIEASIRTDGGTDSKGSVYLNMN